ncbi:MAG TPA: hypothetical protein VKS78_17485 [Roseiarcus sp.]|nr:hypothetical protein [Roseiarcus sp.]
MEKPAPYSAQIDQLRRRSAEFRAKAQKAETPTSRQAYQELAKMYEQMADSVADLEALWVMMREREA